MDATRLIVAGDTKPTDPSVATADVPDTRRTTETSTPLLGRYAPFGASATSTTGAVWEAEDVTQGGRVRCKIVAQNVLPSATWIERALRELKQLSKVATPRLHKIIDQGRSEGGELVIVQESMDSPALDEVIRRDGPMSPPRALKVVQQIGEALIEAQKVGVIHRDVAPQNIFVGDGDEIKVSDFAIAAPVNDKVFGTPQFLSPEQAEGKVPDQRSNIYSLAAVMFYAVTGEAPFGGDPETQLKHHLSSPPPAASTRRPGLPDALDKVLLRALDKSPSKRHLTLKQLLTEFEQACAGAADSPAPKGRAKREPAATMLGIPSPFSQGPQSTPSAKTAVMSTAAAHEIATTPDTNAAIAAAKAKAAEAEARAAADAKAQADAKAAKAQAEAAAKAQADAAAREAQERAAAQAAADKAAAERANAEKSAAERAAGERAAAEKAASDKAAADKSAAEKAAAAQAAKEKADAEERAAREAAAARAAKEADAAKTKADKKKPVPAATAGDKSDKNDKNKGGFRETAWFKRGEIEEEIAKRQAEAASKGDPTDPLNSPAGTTGEMKVHTDDTGADLSGEDVNRLSLRTGSTQAMPVLKVPTGAPIKGDRMNEDDLLAEVDSSKKRLTIAAVVAGILLLIVVAYFGLRKKEPEAPPAPAKVGAVQPAEAPDSERAARPS